MADIIRLHRSPHERTQGLLPWYANGTLDPEEMALVEAHLAECAECRAELEFERVLAPQIASLSIDVEHGWEALSHKLDTTTPRLAHVAFLRRRVALGWVIAGQLAAAAALGVAVYASLPSVPTGQTYHALGSSAANEMGNMVVVFQPDASERDMRSALLETDSRVVDGPNASGAYVLRVAQGSRAQALERLRKMSQIVLAEPVDPGTHP
jgi:hypothetical protein